MARFYSRSGETVTWLEFQIRKATLSIVYMGLYCGIKYQHWSSEEEEGSTKILL